MPNGETAYTRAGSFQTNQDGQIVTPDGYTVLPGITVPAGTLNITINESGQVFAPIDGQIQEQSARTEEHTSELQSLMRNSYAVFCLKKKTQRKSNDGTK